MIVCCCPRPDYGTSSSIKAKPMLYCQVVQSPVHEATLLWYHCKAGRISTLKRVSFQGVKAEKVSGSLYLHADEQPRPPPSPGQWVRGNFPRDSVYQLPVLLARVSAATVDSETRLQLYSSILGA